MTEVDTKIIEDAVYMKLRELGFSDERIAMMPKDELKLWVLAVIKEYGEGESSA